jgi:hypothetical protein
MPIVVVGGGFYQDPAGSDLPPNSALIAVDPSVEFDSYIAMSTGPSTSMFTAAPPDVITVSPFTMAGQMSGAWESHLGAPAIPNPIFDGADAVFIGRLTVIPSVGTIEGRAVAFVIEGEGLYIEPLEIVIPATAGRPSGGPKSGARTFRCRAVEDLAPLPVGPEGGPLVRVFDVYIMEEEGAVAPAMGGAGVAVLGGLLAAGGGAMVLRRRSQSA